MAKDVMVDPRKDGSWAVRTTGSAKALKKFATQKEAAEYGKELARKNKSEFRLKGEDGKVREKRSYK